MFHIDVEHAVSAVVEAMLPKHSPSGRCVYVRLHLSAYAYDKHEDRERNAGRRVHMIFHRPDAYTKVMAAIGNHLGDLKPEDWKQYSDHDSAWRSDGFSFLGTLWRELTKEVGHLAADVHCSIDTILYADVTFDKYKEDGFTAPRSRPLVITLVPRTGQSERKDV